MSVSDHVCPACWRYGSDAMRGIFSENRKWQYSLDIEAALAAAEAELGIIPAEAALEIARKASTTYVKPEAIFEREKKIRHDVMAMVQLLTEACEGDAGKYVHLGATSYDIEDNRLALQMREGTKVLISELAEFGGVLRERAKQYRDLPAIGRTHLQWAEPITFGFKFAKYLADVWADYNTWKDFLEKDLVGKPMTGAVGTSDSYVHLAGKDGAMRIGELVMAKLGLRPALITDQIVSRKMHAEAGHCLTQAAMSGYKFAQEFYHLGRPEIAEVMPRKPDPTKVSSSAMPGKVVLINDIDAENTMGLARIVKALASVGYDNIPTQHERSLDNSSAERIWIPQAYIYTDEILDRCAKKAKGMVVNEEMVDKNLKNATRFSVTEPVLMMLVERGMNRQEAHSVLQHYAVKLWENPGADPVKTMTGFEEITSRLKPDEVGQLIEEHGKYTGLSAEFIDKVLQEADF